MKRNFTSLFIGIGMLSAQFLGSCASGYKSIRPETLQYSFKENNLQDNISLSYMYDGLALRGNKKYVKRELKNAIKVVAVKIENTSTVPLNVGEDCRFYMGDREVTAIDPTLTASLIKQPVPIYLLYSLLNFNVGGTQDPYTGKVTGATFVPTGPVIAIGNMAVAGSANTQMKKDLTTQNILFKTVAPGQTVYGLICLRETSSGPLKIKLKAKPQASTN